MTPSDLILAILPALVAPAGDPAPGTTGDPALDTVIVREILPESLETLPGSAERIGPDRLSRMNPRTAREALRLAPGVAVVEEDAFGLKLNVSVRGLSPRRSGRTLLLEDGVPIQPAPYADPSAHYVPPMDRVEAIEVRRGSAQIPFGPQSVGGVINFITRPAPLRPTLQARAELGERNWVSAHLSGGTGDGQSGVGVALTHKSGDGIRTGHDTQVDEAVLRAHWRLSDGHALDLRVSGYAEDTRLTESGLTEARFAADPFANPFGDDRFDLRRSAAQLDHAWILSDATRIDTRIYQANLFRSSYRQTDTSVDAMTANPDTGCTGAARTDYERFASLCGNKMRPRHFKFWGVETRLQTGADLLGGRASLNAGVRAHSEQTDRKRYNGLFPQARETSAGTVLRDHNQIDVDALSGYLLGSWTVGRLTLSQGVRVEHVETENTARVANFTAVYRTARNEETTVLPGFGASWALTPNLSAFAGVHQGFAPPRPDRDFDPNAPFNQVKPEKSIETEIGVRGRMGADGRFQAVLFNMPLEDLIVEGPLVGGRSGSFLNAGEALHQGLELSGEWSARDVRLSVAYSWLFTAELQSNVDLGASGVRGNRIPYAPEHQLDLAAGYRFTAELEAEIGVNLLDEQFANASNVRTPSADGLSGLIPARSLWRTSVNYRPRQSPLRVYVSVQNLTDEAYIASRVDGLFAGTPRSVVAGIEASF